MSKESIIKALEMIIKVLDESDIDIFDRTELMINISHFLDEKQYEENIKKLNYEKKRSRYNGYNNKSN